MYTTEVDALRDQIKILKKTVRVFKKAVKAALELDGVDCECSEGYVCVSCGLVAAVERSEKREED